MKRNNKTEFNVINIYNDTGLSLQTVLEKILIKYYNEYFD